MKKFLKDVTGGKDTQVLFTDNDISYTNSSTSLLRDNLNLRLGGVVTGAVNITNNYSGKKDG